MKLGLSIGYSGAHLDVPVNLVQRAEELGYDSVWTAEAYGSDAVTPLAYLAAVTKRIKLGTGIMQLDVETDYALTYNATKFEIDISSHHGNQPDLGLSYLLEAMAKLRTERDDIRLTIIGRPREGASNDLIDKLGLRPHIDFVSGVPDERIVELYAEAELAVVPSLYEGFSLPAIEAMATGICLVATDGGALPEVTGSDGDTVLQCKAGDVEALAATIRRGLDDAELRARVGLAGRARVVDRWTWKHCAQLTVDQYREVLAMPANVAKLEKNGRLRKNGRV